MPLVTGFHPRRVRSELLGRQQGGPLALWAPAYPAKALVLGALAHTAPTSDTAERGGDLGTNSRNGRTSQKIAGCEFSVSHILACLEHPWQFAEQSVSSYVLRRLISMGTAGQRAPLPSPAPSHPWAPQSPSAARTKNHRLGGSGRTETYRLPVWRPEAQN